MAFNPPSKKWWKPLGKDERIWSLIIIIMILMMSIIVIGWVFIGAQNPPDQYTKMTAAQYLQAASTTNTPGNGVYVTQLSNGVTALMRNTTGDIYLVAQRFTWTAPAFNGSTTNYYNGIQLKEGVHYRLHLSSVDVLHGFELLENTLSLQVVPGYNYIVDFIPNTIGMYRIICNEFCGVGHDMMTGYLEVVT